MYGIFERLENILAVSVSRNRTRAAKKKKVPYKKSIRVNLYACPHAASSLDFDWIKTKRMLLEPSVQKSPQFP